jgi:hypothetical protein
VRLHELLGYQSRALGFLVVKEFGWADLIWSWWISMLEDTLSYAITTVSGAKRSSICRWKQNLVTLVCDSFLQTECQRTGGLRSTTKRRWHNCMTSDFGRVQVIVKCFISCETTPRSPQKKIQIEYDKGVREVASAYISTNDAILISPAPFQTRSGRLILHILQSMIQSVKSCEEQGTHC